VTPAQELELLRLRKAKAMAAKAAPQEPPSIQPAPEPPQEAGPSAGRASVLGFASGGTMGFVDELGGLIGRALIPEGVKLTPEAKRLAAEKGIELPPEVSNYDLVRDAVRREAAEAKAAHPKSYLGGQLAGGVASAVVAPGGAAKTLGQVARTGAALGGVNAIGASEADTVGGVAKDAAVGAGTGAAFGVAGTQVARALPMATRFLSDKLREIAASQGKKVLTSGADQLSGKAALVDDVALEALRSGGIVPFGTTRGALARLEGAADDVGNTYGAMLDRAEQLGAQGPNAANLASALRQRAARETLDTMEDRVPAAFIDEADRLATKTTTGTLGLRQAENLKRSLQGKARFGEFKDTPVNEARKEIASMFRQANEEALEQAGRAAGPTSELAEISRNFVPVKQQLGRLLQARDAAERGVAAAAKRTGTPMPGAMEIGNAIVSGNPAALAAKLPGSFIKGRVPSALASGAYAGSRLLGGAVSPAVRAAGSESFRAAAGREGATLGSQFADFLRARAAAGGLADSRQNLTPEQQALVEALRAKR